MDAQAGGNVGASGVSVVSRTASCRTAGTCGGVRVGMLLHRRELHSGMPGGSLAISHAAVVLACALAAACAVKAPAEVAVEAPTCRSDEIRWQRPAATEDHSVLDAWCVAVGPPVISEAPGGSEAVADSLLVVSWNINVGGGDLLRFVADLRAGKLTGGERVQHFVLLIQEAFRAGDDLPGLVPGARGAARIAPEADTRIAIAAAAEALGLHLFYVPSMRNGMERTGIAEDRGNAILATIPLAEPAAVELPYEAQRRVAASATVAGRVDAGCPWTLRLTSVHLDHRSRLERGVASFGPGRARQAQALANAIAAPDAVVGGDLNTWGPAVFEEAKPILRAHFPDTPASDGAPTISFAGVISRRIDHLLSRLTAGLAGPVHRVDDAYGSDHHPVLGWVHFDGRCG
jgi:hypothetical protein